MAGQVSLPEAIGAGDHHMLININLTQFSEPGENGRLQGDFRPNRVNNTDKTQQAQGPSWTT